MAAKWHIVQKIERVNLSIDGLLGMARRVAPHSAVLLSNDKHTLGRYSVLAMFPYLDVSYSAPDVVLRDQNGIVLHHDESVQEPLELLSDILSRHIGTVSMDPYTSGCIGFISYDFCRCLEPVYPGVPRFSPRIPDIFFRFFRCHIVMDHFRKTARAAISGIGSTEKMAAADLNQMEKRLEEMMKEDPAALSKKGSSPPSGIQMELSPLDYMDKIRSIKEYIRLGHVYQVNFSHAFKMDWSAAGIDILTDLFQINPVPFAGWFPFPGGEIISLSPECFLLRRGGSLQTFPIKGTRPRGKNRREDKALLKDLLSSPKDGAELAMIVDLERNDLGKICRGGSVVVSRHRVADMFETLHHTYSEVEGELLPDSNLPRILRATFPGGSITGVPKVRCMQIIHEMEGEGRDIYTGSLGHIHLKGDFSFNIAIRTMLKQENSLRFRMGGGIVYDSDPKLEYEETLHKARAFYLAAGGEPTQNIFEEGP